MTYLKKSLLTGLGLLGVFLIYEILTMYIAYTDDAYVRSEALNVASEVTGKITSIDIKDNQQVKIGDPLFTVDPKPFELAVNEQLAAANEVSAQLQADDDAINIAKAAISAADSSSKTAQASMSRRQTLIKNHYVSQEDLDRATDQYNSATSGLTQAQSSLHEKYAVKSLHEATLAKVQAEIATAKWRLSKTKVVSPVNGTINHLTIRIGDTATENIPIVGIIDTDAWRIIANYKQGYLRNFKIGQKAWVWLDLYPWRLYRAEIDGIARGISRTRESVKLLPYVEPTTDWIRLQRRFPVSMKLVDPPKDLKLYMGADARTVIFP